MSRRHPKRKTTTPPFVMLPKALLGHVAVTTLDHGMFRVLVLLAAAFDGSNNGALGVTAAQAAKNGVRSRNTLYKALRELTARGLIVQTYPASRVPPRPTMYGVTWRPLNDTEYSRATRVASHDYRGWTPGRAAA